MTCGLCLHSSKLLAQNKPTFKAKVDLVVLSFTVQDRRGHYVKNLKPSDFRVLEDGIGQKISTFAEGTKPAMRILEDGSLKHIMGDETADTSQPGPELPTESLGGASIYLLFDTSNMMYRSFVYAEDAIADFVRNVDKADGVALYTFSRNLSRVCRLSHNRNDVIEALRKSVAGDETALYNALLLTLRDGAKVPGRKAVIVFSNGPDNASMVAPDDVRAVAEDEGIPIYVISTNDIDKDPISNDDTVSNNVFRRLTSRTGGKAYWANTWQKQVEAFESIREDLDNSYTVSYYPAPNPNEGFRKISVEMLNDSGKKLRVRARLGYRPHVS
jgi:VWFA-related protein